MSVEELVKELRKKWMRVHDLSGVGYMDDPDCQEAADRLEELATENERLSERVETLESFRPHWAQGYSSDSMAAQAATAALSGIWKFLGVSNQTEAMSALAEKDKEIAELKRRQKELEIELSGVRRSYFAERMARNAGDNNDQ